MKRSSNRQALRLAYFLILGVALTLGGSGCKNERPSTSVAAARQPTDHVTGLLLAGKVGMTASKNGGIRSPATVRGFVSAFMFPFRSGYFRDARKWGANVIRLQLHPGYWALDHHEKFMQGLPGYLHELRAHLRRAQRAGLKVVLDLHGPPFARPKLGHLGGTRAYWKMPGLTSRFCTVWRDIVKAARPWRKSIYGYDLYNEPRIDTSHGPIAPAQWRPLAKRIIKTIRQLDKKTWIIFEVAPYDDPAGFTGLKPLPYSHVIYSVHFYMPWLFTSQGLQGHPRPVYYPGMIHGHWWNRATMVQRLAPVIEFQNRYRVPIYVGEFSVIRWAPRASAARWLQDAISIFESHHWSWTYHAFGEYNGWSLKYGSTYWKPGMPLVKADHETLRAKVIKTALQKNWRPTTPAKTVGRTKSLFSRTFVFSGPEALAGWTVSAGTKVTPLTVGTQVQGTAQAGVLYRWIDLNAGLYALRASGSNRAIVTLWSKEKNKAVARLTLTSSDRGLQPGVIWDGNFCVFKAPGGPVKLVVGTFGRKTPATVQWIKIASPPVATDLPGAALRNAIAHNRPSPWPARGVNIDIYNPATLQTYLRARRWGANIVRIDPPRFDIWEWHHHIHAPFWQAWPTFVRELVDQVKLARKAGLKVILNLPPPFLHQQSGDWWYRADLQRRFCREWMSLATATAPYRSSIWGFDILNEPLNWSDMPWPAKKWRGLAISIIHTIRKVDPKTWIVYEPGPGGLDRGFHDLVPLPDAHVIYSLHTYDPSVFCMQGLFDVKGLSLAQAKKKINIRYPGWMAGAYWDKKRLEQVYDPVVAFQKRWHAPIFVGEFSAVQWAPGNSTARWLHDAISIFESHHWSWTYFEFRRFDAIWSLMRTGQFWRIGMPIPPLLKGITAKEVLMKKALRKNLDN